MAPRSSPLLGALLLLSTGCPQDDRDFIDPAPGPVIALVHGPEDGTVVLGGARVALVGSVERVAQNTDQTDRNPPGTGVGGYWTDPDGQMPCGFSSVTAQADNGQTLDPCEVTVPIEPGEHTYTLTPFQAPQSAGPGSEPLVPEAYQEYESQRARITLVVADNTPPIVHVLRPTAEEVLYADHLVPLTARAADAEDAAEQLRLTWTSSTPGLVLPGELVPDSSGEATAFASLPQGQHALTVEVRDQQGATDRESLVVSVGPPNAAPACEITAPAEGERIRTAGELTLRGQASDPDVAAHRLSATWSSSRDGVLASGAPATSGALISTVSGLTGGSHALTLTVVDEVGEQCQDVVTLLVNRPPSATAAQILPATPTVGQAVSCAAISVTDPDGDATQVDLRWTVNGANAGASGSLDTTALAAGDVLGCSATPRDDLDAGPPVSTAVALRVAPPSITAVQVTPEEPTATSTLACAWTGFSDPAGGPDQSVAAWSVNSTPASTGPQLSSGFAKGDQVTCTVTPSNGATHGTSLSDSVVVRNTAPSATVSIDPSAPSPGDPLRCEVSAADLDGDPLSVSVEWLVDGVAFPRSPGEQTWLAETHHPGDTISAAHTGPGETWTCRATVFDGEDAVARETSVEIDIPLPTVTNVRITPPLPRTGDDLTCSWTFLDPSGGPDQSSLVWGVSAHPSGTDPVLSHVHTAKGDEVECHVYPYNGTTQGLRVSDVVIIQNTPPTAAARFNPDPVREGDSLVCELSALADADADRVTIGVSWDLNGRAFPIGTESTWLATTTLPGDTIRGANTAEGQGWRCTITVDDGEDAVDAVAETVVLEAPLDPPAVTITSPTDNAEISATSTTVSGIHVDADSVAWSSSLGQGACNRTATAFTCAGVPLSTSFVTITVTGTNPAGTGTDTVRVRRDPGPPPTISITSPASGASLDVPAVTVSGTHSGATQVRYSSTGPAGSGTCSRSTTSFTCSSLALSESWQTITVTAENEAGTDSDSVSVRYERPYECTDRDGDGYGSGRDCLGADCNDNNRNVHPAATESCDLVDQNCNGLLDDNPTCWVPIYRYRDASQRRCWGTTETPSGACSGYTSEIEAFVLFSTRVPGSFTIRQCSKSGDNILVTDGSSDHNALVSAGYGCSRVLGYAPPLSGSPPASKIPYSRRSCPLYRYRQDIQGTANDTHFFTRGADSLLHMTCEPPARWDVFTSHPCFGSASAAACN